MKRVLQFALALALCGSAFGQLNSPIVKSSTSPFPLQGSGMLYVSPTALGVNALTEPGSGTTALSNIIDMTGARAVTLKFVCTQGTITVNVQTYDVDGTTQLGLFTPVSAVAASTKSDLYIATEQDIQASSGTLGTKIRLPQKAIAFSFTNASASAGTCTASLLVAF